jgi:hypothetical protein
MISEDYTQKSTKINQNSIGGANVGMCSKRGYAKKRGPSIAAIMARGQFRVSQVPSVVPFLIPAIVASIVTLVKPRSAELKGQWSTDVSPKSEDPIAAGAGKSPRAQRR